MDKIFHLQHISTLNTACGVNLSKRDIYGTMDTEQVTCEECKITGWFTAAVESDKATARLREEIDKTNHKRLSKLEGLLSQMEALLDDPEEIEHIIKEARNYRITNSIYKEENKKKTCPYRGCPDPFKMSPPCALCYE